MKNIATKLFCALLALHAGLADAAPSFSAAVHTPGGTNSGSSITTTSPQIATDAGQAVVALFRVEGGGTNDAATITCADTAGNSSYTVGPVRDNDGGSEGKKVFSAYVLSSAGSDATNEVTCTSSAARTFRGLVVAVFDHDGTLAYLGNAEGVSDTNVGTFTTGTVSAQVGDLMVGFMGTWETIPAENATLDSGWTAMPASPPADRLENGAYQIAASATTYAFSGVLSSADSHNDLLLHFRESGGGGESAVPVIHHHYQHN